jgi:hypothetical protein
MSEHHSERHERLTQPLRVLTVFMRTDTEGATEKYLNFLGTLDFANGRTNSDSQWRLIGTSDDHFVIQHVNTGNFLRSGKGTGQVICDNNASSALTWIFVSLNNNPPHSILMSVKIKAIVDGKTAFLQVIPGAEAGPFLSPEDSDQTGHWSIISA